MVAAVAKLLVAMSMVVAAPWLALAAVGMLDFMAVALAAALLVVAVLLALAAVVLLDWMFAAVATLLVAALWLALVAVGMLDSMAVVLGATSLVVSVAVAAPWKFFCILLLPDLGHCFCLCTAWYCFVCFVGSWNSHH
jgi:hypothetical protein